MKHLTTSKFGAIAVSVLMVLAIGGAFSTVHGQVTIPTIAFCNVSPNPVGVGQYVTVDFWLATPLPGGELATNMVVTVTTPSGTTSTLGNFTADYTGGTTTHYIPSATGNYTFQLSYGGQTLTGIGETGPDAYKGEVMEPSTSNKAVLVVQQAAVGGISSTPLPTTWWQTPVNSENVQNWYTITGPWLGLASNAFGATGAYNDSGNENPYTMGPTTGHILWTKPWSVGGVAGGDAGGNEQTGSYWTTSQYEPKWEPVVIDGMLYSTWYTTDTSYSNGIVATDLYNGQTLWTINTQNPLVGGYQPVYETPNQYGVTGPYLITTGNLPGVVNTPGDGEYNLYDALTGTYVCSIVNGTTPGAGYAGGFMTVDNNGNWVGYYTNFTYSSTGASSLYSVPEHTSVGTALPREDLTGPALCAWNMTMALGETNAAGSVSEWTLAIGQVFNFDNGLMWAAQTIPTTLNGASLITQGFFGPSGLNGGGLTIGQIASNVIVLTSGYGSGAGIVGETAGWAVEAGFSQINGQLLWIYNRTYTPYTRVSSNFYNLAGDGVYVDCDENTYQTTGYSLDTGKQLWQITLTAPNGGTPNPYDEYGIQNVVDSTTGVIYLWGLGGDIWAINMTNGAMLWQTSTALLQGSSGTETPYAIWPIWVQYGGMMAGGNNMLYLSEGHEYSPPLFHGAQMLAINATNGQLVWSELAFEDTAAEVSYNIMTAYNSYDGQIYAYGQGPSATTVSAPNIGVTTATPITITGTVMDVSAGASQQAVKSNFPNGLPCVSDASMSQFMEAVYEQQVMPNNVTGVPVTISVLDSNGNYRTIGTTTTNAQGEYGYTWTPDIPGNYTVYATFAGTDAYYGSSASTYFYASPAASSATPTPAPVSGLASNTTLEYGIVGIIVVIVLIGAVLAVLVTRKHP